MAQWNEIPASTGKEAVSRTYPAGYRTDVIDVPIQGEVEYMVRMNAGCTMVYSWEVPGVSNSQSFYTEFHGHTESGARTARRSDVLREGGRFDGERLLDRAVAGHPRLVLAEQERGPGDGPPAHVGVL